MTHNKKILITGGSGLLGVNWGTLLSPANKVMLALNEREISLTSVKTCKVDYSSTPMLLDCVSRFEPDIIIHTAGLTNIEQCEQSPELAANVNVGISVAVCTVCKTLEIPMIHISTDNLFDGTCSMVKEDHPINPVNMYGKTKAEAEKRIQDIYDNVLIVRTNFYGWGPSYKQSFSDVIIDRLTQGSTVSLFGDVYYTPIYMPMLVNTTHEILEKDGRGIFHVGGDERLSKYEFGKKLATRFGLDTTLIKKGLLKNNKELTNRPLDMSMDNTKARTFLGRQLGGLDKQLTEFMKDKSAAQVTEIKSL